MKIASLRFDARAAEDGVRFDHPYGFSAVLRALSSEAFRETLREERAEHENEDGKILDGAVALKCFGTAFAKAGIVALGGLESADGQPFGETLEDRLLICTDPGYRWMLNDLTDAANKRERYFQKAAKEAAGK